MLTRCGRARRTRPADVIGSVTLVVVKGDERAEQYRQQMQNLQKYAALNDLPLVRAGPAVRLLPGVPGGRVAVACSNTAVAANVQDLKENMLSHLKLSFNNEKMRCAGGGARCMGAHAHGLWLKSPTHPPSQR